MKTLKLTLMILASLLTLPAISYSDDRSDRLNSDSSYTFSPGYINAAKQQMESLKVNIPGEEKKRGFLENAIEYVKNKMGRNTREQLEAKSNISLDVQKKTGGVNPAAQTIAANALGQLIDSSQYNVAIGTGTNQESDASGRLMAEVINGTRHVYAGFDSYGTSTIQDAIDLARAGDRIIVRSGEHGESISITKGVILCGGYSEDGTRDIINTPTRLMTLWGQGIVDTGDQYAEINGFLINASGGDGFYVRNSTNVVLINNTFEGQFYIFDYSNMRFENNAVSQCGTYFFNGNYSIIGNVFSGGICIGEANVTLSHNEFNSYMIDAYGSDISSVDNNFYSGGAINGANTEGMNMFEGSRFSSVNDYIYDSAGKNLWNQVGGLVSVSGSASAPNQYARSDMQVSVSPVIANNLAIATLNPYEADNIYNRRQDGYDNINQGLFARYGSGKLDSYNKTGNILFSLLNNKEVLEQSQGYINPGLLSKMITWDRSSVAALPGSNISPQDMEIATKLASILANPTQDQQIVIDSLTSLLSDMQQKESGDNPELQKASSDLLAAVANVLLAQAIPDLLKEGDISNIRNIFSQLDSGKSRILQDYKQSTKPYYDEVKKIIERNAGALDTQMDLKKLLQKEVPRSEIDKILEELKNKSKRSFEEDYILQQESKLKEKYIDPNKKKLENDMKQMISDVTKKLSATLEAVKPR